jgi:hypothetical protein
MLLTKRLVYRYIADLRRIARTMSIQAGRIIFRNIWYISPFARLYELIRRPLSLAAVERLRNCSHNFKSRFPV